MTGQRRYRRRLGRRWSVHSERPAIHSLDSSSSLATVPEAPTRREWTRGVVVAVRRSNSHHAHQHPIATFGYRLGFSVAGAVRLIGPRPHRLGGRGVNSPWRGTHRALTGHLADVRPARPSERRDFAWSHVLRVKQDHQGRHRPRCVGVDETSSTVRRSTIATPPGPRSWRAPSGTDSERPTTRWRVRRVTPRPRRATRQPNRERSTRRE